MSKQRGWTQASEVKILDFIESYTYGSHQNSLSNFCLWGRDCEFPSRSCLSFGWEAVISVWVRKYVCELEHLLLLLSFQEDIASQGNEWASCWRGSRGRQSSLRRQRNNSLERDPWVSLRGWRLTLGAHSHLCSSGGIEPPSEAWRLIQDSIKILLSKYSIIRCPWQHLCLW